MAKDISSLYGKSVTSSDDSSVYPDMMDGDYYYKDTDSIKLKRPSFLRRLLIKIKECPHFCKLCKYRKICDISW